VFRDILEPQDLCKLALRVFHAVAFIHDYILPMHLGQLDFVLYDVFVSSDEHIELPSHQSVGDDLLPFLWSAFVYYHFDSGRPLLEFNNPIRNGGKGDHYEVRPLVAFVIDQVGK